MSAADGGSAFPYSALTPEGPMVYGDSMGITARDYFAAKALQGFLSNAHLAKREPMHRNDMAQAAYQLADAMLKARAQ